MPSSVLNWLAVNAYGEGETCQGGGQHTKDVTPLCPATVVCHADEVGKAEYGEGEPCGGFGSKGYRHKGYGEGGESLYARL